MTDQTIAPPTSTGVPTTSPLNPSQTSDLMAELVRVGALTQDAANEKLAAAGISIEADTRSDAAKEFDSTPSLAGAKPEQYRLNLGYRFPDADPETVLQIDRDMTGFLSAAGLPVGVGEEVAERILNVRDDLKIMSPAERGLWEQTQRMQLERLLGPNYADRVSKAVPYLNRAKGQFVNALVQSGATRDASILTQLVLNAERLAAREKL
jgi:hypothetical protein